MHINEAYLSFPCRNVTGVSLPQIVLSEVQRETAQLKMLLNDDDEEGDKENRAGRGGGGHRAVFVSRSDGQMFLHFDFNIFTCGEANRSSRGELSFFLSSFCHLVQKGHDSPNKHGSICSLGRRFHIRGQT